MLRCDERDRGRGRIYARLTIVARLSAVGYHGAGLILEHSIHQEGRLTITLDEVSAPRYGLQATGRTPLHATAWSRVQQSPEFGPRLPTDLLWNEAVA